ncbi:lysr-family transcriptional regulatory protein [Photorhabdus asymbiotica]|uniref:Lysr-family transcriptional regulatory protein n=2 Tax=Photorhabdus asymbiotica TaxID=291112 RepID=C7BQM6_PHOAA|nr:lysr-family transcriptional regulatory protein [Photorhabdus asymbiotica]
MDEFQSLLLGNIYLKLLTTEENLKYQVKNYIKLEWGADFHHQEQRILKSEQLPIITTTSAHVTRQLLNSVRGTAFLPIHWQNEYSELVSYLNTELIERPLYAIWLQKNDQQTLIQQLLKIPVINTSING